MTRYGRRTWSMRILHWLPESVLSAPERIFLKFACIIIGLGLVGTVYLRPDSPLLTLPGFVVVEIGLAFVVGGVAAIAGIITNNRSLERLGLAATAYASMSYAVVLALVLGWPAALISATIFTGLAFAAGTRLIVSSAAASVASEAARFDS